MYATKKNFHSLKDAYFVRNLFRYRRGALHTNWSHLSQSKTNQFAQWEILDITIIIHVRLLKVWGIYTALFTTDIQAMDQLLQLRETYYAMLSQDACVSHTITHTYLYLGQQEKITNNVMAVFNKTVTEYYFDSFNNKRYLFSCISKDSALMNVVNSKYFTRFNVFIRLSVFLHPH